MTYLRHFKACVRYFLSDFYFFTKTFQPFKIYEKCFLFHLIRSFRSQHIQIFVFFPFLSTDLKGQMEVE